MSILLLQGDCRETLRTLEPESIQTCITSPPYYGLRDYGLEPLVWGGNPEHEHEWGSELPVRGTSNWDSFNDYRREGFNNRSAAGKTGNIDPATKASGHGSWCECGAWSGSLGLEPTPELFIEHLVEVFREVRRVLHRSGTLWMNLGDSYAGSGKGPTGHNGIGDQAQRQGFTGGRGRTSMKVLQGDPPEYANAQQRSPGGPGYKQKDLMMMPARVAMALQADGWYLRSQIPWLKRNSMPESVNDRPATSVEYVYLLAKNPKYFWDADAVRQAHQDVNRPEGPKGRDGVSAIGFRPPTKDGIAREQFIRRNNEYNPAGRNLRNADFFFQTWQGLEVDEDGDPLALVVNPAPYKGAHYATFPIKLVEPMVKASTSEKGQCPECGSPWARVMERGELVNPRNAGPSSVTRGDSNPSPVNRSDKQPTGGAFYESKTTGWEPTCAHAEWRYDQCEQCGGVGLFNDELCLVCDGKGEIKSLVSAPDPMPQTVLDCFGGSGTVGVVADRMNRGAVLCELSGGYGGQAHARVTGDAPLFVDMEIR